MGQPRNKSSSENPVVAFFAMILSGIIFFGSFAYLRGHSSQDAEFQKIENARAELERMPSSADITRDKRRFGSAHLELLEAGCLEAPKTNIETGANLVRLSAHFCAARAAEKNISMPPFVREIRARHARKEIALVGFFEPRARLVSTEYFPLEPGENKIEMEILFRDGRTQKMEFNIARRDLATANASP